MNIRWSCSFIQASVKLILVAHVATATQSFWDDLTTFSKSQVKCSNNNGLKYLAGNALEDSFSCMGPNNAPYPSSAISRLYSNIAGGSSRRGRQTKFPTTLDPMITQQTLMSAYSTANQNDVDSVHHRYGRSAQSESSQCKNTPPRLCKTRYNTTAPMYGISLTSGQPVTIVQKFPDLLQQVIFEVCESSECDVVRGECTQTYVPYLFLVIPLGPVTLTGQDYVLVESGCVCRPKYAMEGSPQDVRQALPELK